MRRLKWEIRDDFTGDLLSRHKTQESANRAYASLDIYFRQDSTVHRHHPGASKEVYATSLQSGSPDLDLGGSVMTLRRHMQSRAGARPLLLIPRLNAPRQETRYGCVATPSCPKQCPA
jgi:hypothetical protein